MTSWILKTAFKSEILTHCSSESFLLRDCAKTKLSKIHLYSKHALRVDLLEWEYTHLGPRFGKSQLWSSVFAFTWGQSLGRLVCSLRLSSLHSLDFVCSFSSPASLSRSAIHRESTHFKSITYSERKGQIVPRSNERGERDEERGENERDRGRWREIEREKRKERGWDRVLSTFSQSNTLSFGFLSLCYYNLCFSCTNMLVRNLLTLFRFCYFFLSLFSSLSVPNV